MGNHIGTMFVPRKKKTKPSLDSDSSTTFSTTSSTLITTDSLSKVLDPDDNVLMDNYNIQHYIFKHTWKVSKGGRGREQCPG